MRTKVAYELLAEEILAKIDMGDYEGEDCQEILDQIVREYPDLESCIFGPEDGLDERMPGGKRKKAPEEPGVVDPGIAKRVQKAARDVQKVIEGLKTKSASQRYADVPDLVREASRRGLSGDGVMRALGLGPRTVPPREFNAMERAAFGLPGGVNLRGKGAKPALPPKPECRKMCVGPCRCRNFGPRQTVYQGRRR